MSNSAGRARGFGARGRPVKSAAPSTTEASPSSIESGNESDGGNGNGNGQGEGAPLRGRGGFYSKTELVTKPRLTTTTVGEGGQAVQLCANYFKLMVPQDVTVYQYHVSFEPQIESSRMRRALLMDHKDLFGRSFIFDGMSCINSTRSLSDEETEVFSTRRTDSEKIKIIIKRTGEISWGHLEMIRLYNTQMRRNMQHLKQLLIGRHFFDPQMKLVINEYQIELWQGLLTAVNRHDGGLLMVCDTVFKVVRTDTVYKIMKDILGRGDRQNFQDNVRRELAGSIVMTSYNNKTYKIDDIAFNMNPRHTFERKQESISMIDYYQQQYNIRIRDTNQPLLLCLPSVRDQRAGVTNPIYLVPELCVMTGLTDSLKSNFDLKKKMTQVTQADPNRRLHNLHNFIRKLKSNQLVKTEMDSWGLNFDNNVVNVPGRVLPPEKVLMNGEMEGQGSSYNPVTADFSKEIRGKPMKTPVFIQNWAIIVSPRDSNTVDDFANTLNRVCTPMGIRMNRPNVRRIDNDRTTTYVDVCMSVPNSMNMVVIIIPNNNKDRYDAIKKIFCTSRPIPSQVVVSRTISKKQMLMSVCTKIGIQMAVKLGAEAWYLNIPPRQLMVVGYDTYHDTSKRGQSVGGFVCSLNPTLTRWYSRAAFHKNREEMSSNFATNMSHGMKRYHELNGKLPERIVVYRDGVSDGQIEHVFNTELKQIKDIIKKIANNEQIRLAFVIVTKRVNARFFRRENQNQFGNPVPGTVVDTVVTRPERYDFYLISQSVRQGTVSPTMYNLIEDETNWRPMHHQQLAYKLCHLYYNWPGTISVPAPCQYAHKLAFLTGNSLHQEPNVALSSLLFYL